MKRTIYGTELNVITMVREGEGKLEGKGRKHVNLNAHHLRTKPPDAPLTPLYRPNARIGAVGPFVLSVFGPPLLPGTALSGFFLVLYRYVISRVVFCAVEFVVSCCCFWTFNLTLSGGTVQYCTRTIAIGPGYLWFKRIYGSVCITFIKETAGSASIAQKRNKRSQKGLDYLGGMRLGGCADKHVLVSYHIILEYHMRRCRREG